MRLSVRNKKKKTVLLNQDVKKTFAFGEDHIEVVQEWCQNCIENGQYSITPQSVNHDGYHFDDMGDYDEDYIEPKVVYMVRFNRDKDALCFKMFISAL